MWRLWYVRDRQMEELTKRQGVYRDRKKVLSPDQLAQVRHWAGEGEQISSARPRIRHQPRDAISVSPRWVKAKVAATRHRQKAREINTLSYIVNKDALLCSG